MMNDQDGKNIDHSLKFGKLLSNPPPNEEVVITGMSGIFPKAKNIDELEECLYNKIDMITPQKREIFLDPELPVVAASIDKSCTAVFDTGYFGVHPDNVEICEPQHSYIMEKVTEAIMDAGLHPSDLQNTKSGLFLGTCVNDVISGIGKIMSILNKGNIINLIASSACLKVAHNLKITGPIVTCDTACSSSLFALEHAYKAIRLGECDNAIVIGSNMCLFPGSTIQFYRLGVLSKDGHCKSFDKEGKGYVRAEAISVIILQKTKDAKRIYAKLIHAKTNSDGAKEHGITYPSGDDQFNLLKEVYEECGISPTKLSFVEAHGTGTPVGDPEECRALEKHFVPGRTTPLMIGSIKSNLGHSEPTSGLCSIIKCILAFEKGIFPPNLHYKTPRPTIPALVDGRIQVVTEPTEFKDDNYLIGINSFGFGGANCHVLLKGEKYNNPTDDSPRLLCVSGRSKEAVTYLLDDVSHRELNTDYIGLLHNIFRKNIPQHPYRGYSILTKNKEVCRSIQRIRNVQKKIYLIFGELDHWYQIAESFTKVPIFNDSFQRIASILHENGIVLASIFNSAEHNRKANRILGGAIVQICFADMIKELTINTTATMGYGYGELICAYYDKVINLSELLKCLCLLNRELNQNVHLVNGNHVEATDSESQEKPSANVLLELRQTLKKGFTNILLYPRPWKSTSIRKKNASADYFTDASLKWMNEIGVDISKYNADVLEMGFSDLHIIKELENLDFITFQDFEGFLRILGRFYESGQNPLLAKLYPKINTPVNTGTPNISSKIKWLHEEDRIKIYKSFEGNKYTISGNVDLREWSYISGHIIDGRILYPAAGYLQLVWHKFIEMVNGNIWLIPVVFENCRFLVATTMTQNGTVTFEITISKSGYFEIYDGNTLIVTGNIRIMNDSEFQPTKIDYRVDEANRMDQKSIYKELSLRGYNYRDEFRSLMESDLKGTSGLVKWHTNWVTFIDSIFQLKILAQDSRLLYVPTHIEKIIINPRYQYDCIQKNWINDNEAVLPISYDAVSEKIRCGGITVSHLQASSIQRKKDLRIPVLEKYEFVPNITELSIQESIRVNMQIILENTLKTQISTVEIVDTATPPNLQVLSQMVIDVLNDQPLIQPINKIYSNEQLDVTVPVENNTLKREDQLTLVIGSKLLRRKEVLLNALEATKNKGYVISREALDLDISNINHNNIEVITMHRTPTEYIVMVTNSEVPKQATYIKVTDEEFKWLNSVQRALNEYDDVILYSENDPLGGLLGLANCLRREPGCINARSLIIYDAKPFNPNDNFYSNQLKKNMAVNIYKNGKWGTYRHLLLDQCTTEGKSHCYVSQTVKGDFSSLKWMEGPIHLDDIPPPGKQIINIHYASLNFRDVMTASGKINADVITTNRLEQECLQGFEFSGLTRSGERVMGLVSNGALASLTMADNNLLWKVPDEWSLEEAASVPVVYGTIIYALRERGNLRRGESILIHSGLGGVGQAAIRYALYHGCNVFTTVGSESRKEKLKELFPELKDNQIGNSHDLSFEQMVMKATNGRGVDLVLNSLAEDKLLTSVRCLRRGGRFLEIGKFDISNNNALCLQLMKNDCSFHGVMLDKLFDASAMAKEGLKKLIYEGIQKGSVKPLPRSVFKFNEVEKAFRFMAGGKHIGKVIVNLQTEDKQTTISQFHAIPKYYCNRQQTYLVIGGLGGFGLEMVDWLVIRGARKLVLNSRHGIKNGYQRSRIRIWRSYGVVIKVSTADVTKREGCIQVIKEAKSLGPVNAIFNLAAVLQDATFQNQTEEMFHTSLSPKAYATKYLDEVSREMCPELSQFVVFSSVSCGRGNAGQTNYGMANSVMERICERRKNCGLPALAIEWGAIGEVGLVAAMQENNLDLEISGTLQQRVASCLQAMDIFLRQKFATIVSSMVVADKKTSLDAAHSASDAICSILGINDIKSVSPHSTLTELGLDSMTAVEIRQHLERDFGISFSARELRSLTFARLEELEGNEETNQEATEMKKIDVFHAIKTMTPNEEELGVIEKHMETNIDENNIAPTVLFLPGLEGFARPFEYMARNLNAHAIGLNYDFNNPKLTVIEEVEAQLERVKKYVKKDAPFIIVSHSYGSNVALEIVSRLESEGYEGVIISIDGAPSFTDKIFKEMIDLSGEEVEIFCLMHLLNTPKQAFLQCKTMDERVDIALDLYSNYLPISVEWQKKLYMGIFQRIKALKVYKPTYSLIKSRVILCKPEIASFCNFPDDYNLSAYCGQLVEVRTYQGDHQTILNNDNLVQYINYIISSYMYV